MQISIQRKEMFKLEKDVNFGKDLKVGKELKGGVFEQGGSFDNLIQRGDL